jgi:hypothetical protein
LPETVSVKIPAHRSAFNARIWRDKPAVRTRASQSGVSFCDLYMRQIIR